MTYLTIGNGKADYINTTLCPPKLSRKEHLTSNLWAFPLNYSTSPWLSELSSWRCFREPANIYHHHEPHTRFIKTVFRLRSATLAQGWLLDPNKILNNFVAFRLFELEESIGLEKATKYQSISVVLYTVTSVAAIVMSTTTSNIALVCIVAYSIVDTLW